MNVNQVIKLLRQKAQRPFDADVAECLGSMLSDIEKVKTNSANNTNNQSQSSSTKTNTDCVKDVAIDEVIQDKVRGVVNLPAYPSKTSDLTNDNNFITKAVDDLTNYYLKSETYTQTEVNSLISAIQSLSFKVVDVLPTTEISTSTIYLISNGTGYDEYVYTDSGWVNIGSTAIDLSDYLKKNDYIPYEDILALN